MAKITTVIPAMLLCLGACGSISPYPTVCSKTKPKTDAPNLAAAQIKADTPNDKAVVLLTQSLATAAEYTKELESFAESCKTNPKFRQPEKRAAPKQAARKG